MSKPKDLQFIMDMPEKEYFELNRLSNSKIKEYFNTSLRHLKQGLDFPKEWKSKALDLGSLFDTLMEDNLKDFDSKYALLRNFEPIPMPERSMNKTENQEWKKRKIEWVGDRIEVDEAMYDKAKAMREDLLSNPVIKKIIDKCKRQVTALWTDPETGLQMKARLDLLYGDGEIVYDYKTGEDISFPNFTRNAFKFGYHRQMGIYSQITGNELSQLIVVDSSDIRGHYLAPVSDNFLKVGRQQMKFALQQIKEAYDRDDWPYQLTHDRDYLIEPPIWAQKEWLLEEYNA